MIQSQDEAMKPNGNKVISLKLTSGENVIAEFLSLDEENGILVVKNPVKIQQGIQDGVDVLLFIKYDPTSADDVCAISAQHVISLQPVSYRFKQQYVSNILRFKLYDIEANNENEIFDYLTTHMMKICDDIGVVADLKLLPVSMSKLTRH